jgi:hypothetical protein
MMNSFRVISATAMFLMLGWTVSANPRQQERDQSKHDEKQQQDRPARQDQPQADRQQRHQQEQQPQARDQQQQQQQHQRQDNSSRQQQQAKGQQDQKPQQRQQQDNSARQQQQARGQHDQERQQEQQHDNRSAQRRSPAQEHQQQVAWQGDRARNWKSDHRTWQQRGGYNGYRVPDARFRAYYGQDHDFRFYSLPVMYVGGHRRFQYGGFWFGLVDPWPEYWSANWYDDDDVYVDYYGDGYYLYNRRYPGDSIAISFYLN